MEYFRRRDFLFCDMCGTMLIMATNKYAECPLCKCKRSAKDNTRMKELHAENKRTAETMEKYYAELRSQIDQLQSANHAKFECMETINGATESKLTQITDALAILLQRNSSSHGSTHGVLGSSNETGKQPFQDIQRDLGIKPLVKVDSNEIDFDHVEVERAKVAEKCRFCGHEGLLCHTMQTRSADEGETVFFECPKCRKTSKE